MTPAPEAALFAGSLLLVRVGAALRLTPFLGGRPLPWVAWAGLSLALSGVLAPTALSGAAVPLEIHPWPLLALKELYVGIVMGASARIAFSIFESTARLAEAAVPMPVAVVETDGASAGSPLSLFYALFGAATFFLVGGHHALLAAMAASLGRVPVAALPDVVAMSAAGFQGGVGLLTSVTAWSILLAGPAFVAGLAADFALGLAARVSPWPGALQGIPGAPRLVVQAAIIASLGVGVSAATAFLSDAVTRF